MISDKWFIFVIKSDVFLLAHTRETQNLCKGAALASESGDPSWIVGVKWQVRRRQGGCQEKQQLCPCSSHFQQDQLRPATPQIATTQDSWGPRNPGSWRHTHIQPEGGAWAPASFTPFQWQDRCSKPQAITLLFYPVLPLPKKRKNTRTVCLKRQLLANHIWDGILCLPLRHPLSLNRLKVVLLQRTTARRLLHRVAHS